MNRASTESHGSVSDGVTVFLWYDSRGTQRSMRSMRLAGGRKQVKVRIESRAPTRIDLAGGTLDIWPLYLFHEGSPTVNCAISRDARSSIDVKECVGMALIS